METIMNLGEAERKFLESLTERNVKIAKVESRVKPGNTRIFTENNDIYHLKFTRSPFRPDADKQGPARELHLKLQFAMNTFEYVSGDLLNPDERGTMVGIDEDLLLALIDFSDRGHKTFVVTTLARAQTLWLPGVDFYNFVMRHDTFIKFPRSGVPVCYVPTGYFFPWAEVQLGFPQLI